MGSALWWCVLGDQGPFFFGAQQRSTMSALLPSSPHPYGFWRATTSTRAAAPAARRPRDRSSTPGRSPSRRCAGRAASPRPRASRLPARGCVGAMRRRWRKHDVRAARSPLRRLNGPLQAPLAGPAACSRARHPGSAESATTSASDSSKLQLNAKPARPIRRTRGAPSLSGWPPVCSELLEPSRCRFIVG